MKAYEEAIGKLNKAQRQAVDTIDGPVMVIAGPGTGKTEVLALRIAHILEATDTPPSGILCLTFTRSGVRAMKKRLERYMGARAYEVRVSTFHSFAADLVEKHFELLDFSRPPRLLDERDAVSLADELLHGHEWEYLRPRGNAAAHFGDLTSLISLLKRERITPDAFLTDVERDIESIGNDPANISSRGATKGELKKEATTKIESLKRTREVAEFYRMYEETKRERGLMDYDDVLAYAVTLVESSEDVRADVRENALYVLVDEHQDSSGVQNAFLRAVWEDTERPNIFVVGDDRQLIYGFGGASLSYFEEFKTVFGKAALITLVENYRSTAPILTLADTLLSSELTKESLHSNRTEAHKVSLLEYSYPRDEVIAAGLEFKRLIEDGAPASECALLVPKNRQVRSALATLRDMGLPVSGGGGESFFDTRETRTLMRALAIVANPNDPAPLATSLFDETSGIGALEAHTFLRSHKARSLALSDLIGYGASDGLFAGEHSIAIWGKKLSSWIDVSHKETLASFVGHVGNELLIYSANDHDTIIRRSEALRTMIHLATLWEATNIHGDINAFLEYLRRLEEYGTHIPLATFGAHRGVQVMTLHASKGLEFESVWIAHMNEEVLMSGKRMGFTLPERIKEKIAEKDLATARREAYVAITRAKVHATISYARSDYKGSELSLARILLELPDGSFVRKDADETEAELLADGADRYTKQEEAPAGDDLEKLRTLVADEYEKKTVSVTLLNNFYECPWKWYFRNFLDLPEVKSDYLALGSAVHAAIEFVLKSSSVPDEASIRAVMLECFHDEGLADERTLGKLMEDGVKTVLAWINTSYGELAPSRESERSLSFRSPSFPHLSLYGKIDLTERYPDGSVSVTDFKTGSAKTVGVIEKRDEENRLSTFVRQLAMYSYLIQGAEKGREVVASKLYFLEAGSGDKNRIYQTRIGAEEIDLLVRDIQDYDKALKSGEWTNRVCHYKPYGTNQEECVYCKLAREVYKKRG